MKCSNCNYDYPVTSAYCTKCGENNPQYSFSQEKETKEYSSQSYVSSNEANRSQSNTYQSQVTPPNANDDTNYGLAVLSFFIPLVGFIIAASLWSSKPNTASACLQAAFWSVGLVIFFNLIL